MPLDDFGPASVKRVTSTFVSSRHVGWANLVFRAQVQRGSKPSYGDGDCLRSCLWQATQLNVIWL